jgi:uncharacterized NAD(P)/FAD-binding protein YdhS
MSQPTPPTATPPTIVIIGGGFSGTLTAIHLLRQGFATHGRLVLVNRSGAMARGVAYGTTSDFHVLNVPAGRMSAFDDDPDSFVRFVRTRGKTVDGEPVGETVGETIDGGTFVGRHLYGAYLESLLTEACEHAPEGHVERLNTEVVAIEPEHDDSDSGAWAWVSLRDGRRIRAARVVLAVGNYPPEDPPVDCGGFFASSRRYVRDPWSSGAFDHLDLTAPILLIGTGLTMVDIALQLQALGASAAMTAVSRRGLLPASHRNPAHVPHTHDLPQDLIEGPANTRAYVRAVRRHVREKAAHGIDWRDTIAALRPITAQLWSALSIVERSRFLRHVRPFWEVHRHRMAPPLYDAFGHLRTTGRVNVIAGRIMQIREQHSDNEGPDDKVTVHVRPRGSHDVVELRVGAVVNCSGPTGDTRRLRDPLFDRLRLQGLVRPDPLGLGIDVGSHGALIDNDGFESPLLYYVGPFLRARDWEATAVPELRQYARRMADHLLDTLPAWDNAGLPFAPPRHDQSPLTIDTRR